MVKEWQNCYLQGSINVSVWVHYKYRVTKIPVTIEIVNRGEAGRIPEFLPRDILRCIRAVIKANGIR
jgi:hypothetical protein